MIGFDDQRKTYWVQLKVKDPVSGKWRTVKKRGFKLKREAKDWEAAHTIENPSLSLSKTFLEVAQEWEMSQQASAEVIRHHTEHFTIRFAEFCDKRIQSITKPQLIKWRSDLAADTRYSTTTKNITISYVRSVFRFAHDVYAIEDPSSVLKRLKKTNSEIMTEMQTWTPEEFTKFQEKVSLPIYSLYFETLFWTGMRRGEAIALQKSDLDDGWVNVHANQRTAVEGLKPTKTKQSRRIRLDDTLAAKLEALKVASDGPYLFGGDTPLSPTTINRVFVTAIRDSGVKPIRLHDLRHSHATWLINHGVNIVAVSKRLGHSTIEQTLKTYTHLLKDTDDQMMDLINHARM